MSVQDKLAFGKLDDYFKIAHEFLQVREETEPTRIVSPSHPNYVFYQYSKEYGHRITRPLNTNLLIESSSGVLEAFERFTKFLGDLKRYQERVATRPSKKAYIESKEINKVVYTIQQCIGSIGD